MTLLSNGPSAPLAAPVKVFAPERMRVLPAVLLVSTPWPAMMPGMVSVVPAEGAIVTVPLSATPRLALIVIVAVLASVPPFSAKLPGVAAPGTAPRTSLAMLSVPPFRVVAPP